MKQIEVRLAVVLYGGVSLAIYIHGVTRELLNLIRASKLFHADDGAPPPAGTTTAIYYDLFRDLSAEIELRVVVDLISGASAGGINGILLGRALAHDLTLEPHRELWLANADVTQLTATSSVAGGLAKAALAPLFDWFLRGRFGGQIDDPETRGKLRHFIQAQWFTPPFSGSRFTGWLLDACEAMAPASGAVPSTAAGASRASLLPPGHRLDLFVTLTDYRGHRHRIALNDPPSVEETEHRRILRFACLRALSGEMVSAFDSDHVPSLVFAARATSSFPGAFPPMSVAEMDTVLEERKRAWPARQRFLADSLFAGVPVEPDGHYFIDGSVVMNKPFSPVIHALGDRPASREVVRRIIYVDPNSRSGSEAAAPEKHGTVPGFFGTILAALAVIPRNEPIADDLLGIQEWNARARRMAEILTAADPQVERLVDQIIDPDPDNPPSLADVARYRALANEKAHEAAGYAYLSYQTLKMRRLIERMAELIAGLAARGATGAAGATASDIGIELGRIDPLRIEALLDRWVGPHDAAGTGPVVSFFRAFDADFRLRRIRFSIRRLNELYRRLGAKELQIQSGALDSLKAALYEVIDRLSHVWEPESYAPDAVAAGAAIARLAAQDGALSEDLLKPIEAAMSLIAIDRDLDEIVSLMGLAYLAPVARRSVAISYVGFAFYDLITFPILQWTEMDEINEVLVDRISPADALGFDGKPVTLKGTALMNFGAFFNRAWREHDYLWGRLNAADRCVSVMVSALGADALGPDAADRLRARLFAAILDEETPHLLADPDLVPGLRRKLAAVSRGLANQP